MNETIKTIKEIGTNHKECGFPVVALPRILAKLENNKINYLVLDRRNNYDVDAKQDYKNKKDTKNKKIKRTGR